MIILHRVYLKIKNTVEKCHLKKKIIIIILEMPLNYLITHKNSCTLASMHICQKTVDIMP